MTTTRAKVRRDCGCAVWLEMQPAAGGALTAVVPMHDAARVCDMCGKPWRTFRVVMMMTSTEPKPAPWLDAFIRQSYDPDRARDEKRERDADRFDKEGM